MFPPGIPRKAPEYPAVSVFIFLCSQCPRSESHRAWATGCLSAFRTDWIQARLQPLSSHTSRGRTSAPDDAKVSPADLSCKERQDGRYQRHAQHFVTSNQHQPMACNLTRSQLPDTMPNSRTKPTTTGQRFTRKRKTDVDSLQTPRILNRWDLTLSETDRVLYVDSLGKDATGLPLASSQSAVPIVYRSANLVHGRSAASSITVGLNAYFLAVKNNPTLSSASRIIDSANDNRTNGVILAHIQSLVIVAAVDQPPCAHFCRTPLRGSVRITSYRVTINKS